MNDDLSLLPTISLSPSFTDNGGKYGNSCSHNYSDTVGDASSAVTVNYATSNLTATAGSDYVASNGLLTFAAGETTKTINITINGDTVHENNESFLISLSTPTGAVLSSTGGAVLIWLHKSITKTISNACSVLLLSTWARLIASKQSKRLLKLFFALMIFFP